MKRLLNQTLTHEENTHDYAMFLETLNVFSRRAEGRVDGGA